MFGMKLKRFLKEKTPNRSVADIGKQTPGNKLSQDKGCLEYEM